MHKEQYNVKVYLLKSGDGCEFFHHVTFLNTWTPSLPTSRSLDYCDMFVRRKNEHFPPQVIQINTFMFWLRRSLTVMSESLIKTIKTKLQNVLFDLCRTPPSGVYT